MKNKNNRKIIVASVLAMLGTSAMAQTIAKGNFEASASIESFCQINAADINFGVVSLPLTAQSANSQMNVLCSNNTPYKVDLSYGGNYVGESSTGTSGVSGITASIASKYTDAYEASSGKKFSSYRLYKNGQPIGAGSYSEENSNSVYDSNLNNDNNKGDFVCNSSFPNKIYFYTKEAALLVDNSKIASTYVVDKHGLCDPATFRLNMTNFTKLFGSGTVADKGIMTGNFKGDKLAYQIALPNDSTKPWIAGVNSYNATGVGSNQVIEMNAKIVPGASSSSYIAQDTYIDTVTATVSY